MMNISMGEFITLIFDPIKSGFIEFYYLIPDGLKPPQGKRWQYGRYAPLPLGYVPDTIPHVVEANAQGYGVYVGVTPSDTAFTEPVISEKTGKPYYPRRKETNVHEVSVIWADLDNTPLEVAQKSLTQWTCKPSIVVKSGGGVHAYWLLDTPYQVTPETKSTVKRLLQGVAKAHAQQGGDSKVRDLARIMRLPGTINTKPARNGAMCEVVTVTGQRHSFTSLYQQFRLWMPTEVLQPTRQINLPVSDQFPRQAQAFIDNPPAQGERNQRLYVAARSCLDAGLSEQDCIRALEATAARIGLERYEIERTISSAYDATPSVQTDDYRIRRIAMRDKTMRSQGSGW